MYYYYEILIFTFHKMLIIVWSSCSKRNIDTKLIYNLDSKFGSKPNIGKVHRIEEDIIVGPNGGKIGLVFQDLVLSYYTAEMTIKNLSNELEISEEEFKNMTASLTEEFKHTSPKCIHVRYWAQKL